MQNLLYGYKNKRAFCLLYKTYTRTQNHPNHRSLRANKRTCMCMSELVYFYCWCFDYYIRSRSKSTKLLSFKN